jgi:hypothetical protein
MNIKINFYVLYALEHLKNNMNWNWFLCGFGMFSNHNVYIPFRSTNHVDQSIQNDTNEQQMNWVFFTIE